MPGFDSETTLRPLGNGDSKPDLLKNWGQKLGSKNWGQVFHYADIFSYLYKQQLLGIMKDLTLTLKDLTLTLLSTADHLVGLKGRE